MIGLGGAGGKALERAAAAMPAGCADCVAIDTDFAALAQLPRCRPIEIGAARFEGLGSAGDKAGSAKALAESADLREIFGSARIAVITAGLGKGGAGLLPPILDAAYARNIPVLCVLTTPFAFEPRETARSAEETLDAIADKPGCCLAVISNDALAAPPDAPADDAAADTAATLRASLDRASAALAAWLSLLWKMTSLHGPDNLNLGEAALTDILRRGAGACHLGFATATGPYRVKTAMRRMLARDGAGIGAHASQARALLVGITGGADLLLREVAETMSAFTTYIPLGATDRIRMGTILDPLSDGALSIAAIAFDDWRDQIQTESDPDELEMDAPAAPARGLANSRSGKTLKRKPAETTKFSGTAPMIINDEDLDKPTYLRRRLNIDLS